MSAFTVQGSPIRKSKDADSLIITEGGKVAGKEELVKAYEDRYPELKEIEGKFSIMRICTRVKNRLTANEGRFNCLV